MEQKEMTELTGLIHKHFQAKGYKLKGKISIEDLAEDGLHLEATYLADETRREVVLLVNPDPQSPYMSYRAKGPEPYAEAFGEDEPRDLREWLLETLPKIKL